MFIVLSVPVATVGSFPVLIFHVGVFFRYQSFNNFSLNNELKSLHKSLKTLICHLHLPSGSSISFPFIQCFVSCSLVSIVSSSVVLFTVLYYKPFIVLFTMQNFPAYHHLVCVFLLSQMPQHAITPFVLSTQALSRLNSLPTAKMAVTRGIFPRYTLALKAAS